MDLYELIRAKRKDILVLAARFGIEDIRIFGSVARHEAREGSDIDFLVEFPTGSGNLLNLAQVAHEIARRLTHLFLPDAHGRRPCFGDDPRYASDPHWKDLVLFHEHFCFIK